MKIPKQVLEALRKVGQETGTLGGKATAANRTPQQRAAAARKAVNARWAAHRKVRKEAANG